MSTPLGYRVGDYGITPLIIINDENGNPRKDLDSATKITVSIQNGSNNIERSCILVDSTNAKIGFNLAKGDLVAPGFVLFDIKVEWEDRQVKISYPIKDIVKN